MIDLENHHKVNVIGFTRMINFLVSAEENVLNVNSFNFCILNMFPYIVHRLSFMSLLSSAIMQVWHADNGLPICMQPTWCGQVVKDLG